MSPRHGRMDLAAMLHPFLKRLVAAEMPVLAAHGTSMWGYVVLTELDQSPIRSQAALADAIGADKTRLIATLDELQARGYIDRRPDPGDRRVRLLEITAAGRKARRAVQSDIQRNEEHWLATLDRDERRTFLDALLRLSRLEPPGTLD